MRKHMTKLKSNSVHLTLYRMLTLTWEENYKGNRGDSLTPIQNGECMIVLPLTSPNTMYKYFPAFPWVATQ